MKNNQLIWAKTLLNAYKYLGALCGAIDKLVDSTAKNSFFASGIWSEENSIVNVSKKIMYLTNKKVDYINLKVIVEKAISSMNKISAKIIVLKYIKGIDCETIAKLNNMSLRSCFRRAKNALSEFVLYMKKIGYTAEKIEINFCRDPFVQSVYSGIKALDQDDSIQTESLLTSKAYTDCVKTFNFGYAG